MKTYVLYHANCPDGFGAALAAWLKFGEQAQYLPVHYGDPVPPGIGDDSSVYILDFSFPRAALEELQRRSRKLLVVDHHKTAAEDLSGFDGAIFDPEHSGAVLAWVVFHGGDKPVPDFFLYLEDRDLWNWRLPHSRAVSYGLRQYPKTFLEWERLLVGGIDTIGSLIKDGTTLLLFVENQVAGAVGNCGFQTIGDYSVPVVNCTANISEVGERLLEIYPMAPFVAMYFDRPDAAQPFLSRRVFSLRSREGFDCSAVARQFGGGGHKQAAGFTIVRKEPLL